jgi:hypothetical protein
MTPAWRYQIQKTKRIPAPTGNVIVEAERLDGIAVAAHIDRDKTGFESAISGFPSAKKDILTSSGLFGLEFDDPAFLNWYSPEDERTPAGAERIKLYNARLQSSATAPRPRLAAVQNSDSHTLAQFTARRTLTRYKMNELGFEGLRTALIDSESRVRAVATIPPSVPRVLGMHVSGGFLANETFSFSDNLNTFIGGRGAGKSTSIRCLAYGLGSADDLEEHDNCPETVVIYCEDDNGILYRYERSRGFETTVRAKDDEGIKDVPVDSFRIEYFGQGDLAEVAKNPLKNASLLQEFLDRHITILDLCERERELLEELAQNSGQLIPLLSSNAQLPGKRKLVSELDVKLKVAETGKVKEIAAYQITLAAEKGVDAVITATRKAGLQWRRFLLVLSCF